MDLKRVRLSHGKRDIFIFTVLRLYILMCEERVGLCWIELLTKCFWILTEYLR